jgi:hypothetical protein
MIACERLNFWAGSNTGALGRHFFLIPDALERALDGCQFFTHQIKFIEDALDGIWPSGRFFARHGRQCNEIPTGSRYAVVMKAGGNLLLPSLGGNPSSALSVRGCGDFNSQFEQRFQAQSLFDTRRKICLTAICISTLAYSVYPIVQVEGQRKNDEPLNPKSGICEIDFNRR